MFEKKYLKNYLLNVGKCDLLLKILARIAMM
jgi:hypothetical protein